MKTKILLLFAFVLSIASISAQESPFKYTDLTGIGYEPTVSRRDPSDVIKVGDTYYVYYSKKSGVVRGIYNGPFSVWYAYSKDGYNWTEGGEAVALGEIGEFDAGSTFTPNIIYSPKDKKYYLYYTATTGVVPTIGDVGPTFDNKARDKYTSIGVASSDSPAGPFVKVGNEPVLRPSVDMYAFDSYLVDDAVLVYKNKKYWFYYKGRNYSDGQTGNKHTHMGVAYSDSPVGPFVKHGKPLLYRNHEAMVWQDKEEVFAYVALDSLIVSSKDGLTFTNSVKVADAPKAPGAFREDLTNPKMLGKTKLEWGVAMELNKGECYIVRYDYDASKLK